MARLADVRNTLDVAPSKIISADGKVLYSIVAENREWVKLDDIPQLVRDATLAAEDRRFYEHGGVDVRAVMRQLFTNAKERRIAGGASTLTMQLAKRVYTSPEQTLDRKIQDMALAVEIEKNYEKDFILEMYLNQVYYGSWAYGIKKAAEVYFNKDLDELTVAEAATLARCVRRPSTENPIADAKTALANRDVVLRTMLEEKMIDRKEYDKAIAEKLHLSKKAPTHGIRGPKKAPYFVDYILSVLHDKYPNIHIEEGGYTIQTTLDTRLQEKSDEGVKRIVDRYRRSNVTTGCFLLLNRDGAILAMSGGYDYDRDQYNATTMGKRQPGSSFKPFVYSLDLEQRVISPDTPLVNDKHIFRLSGQQPYSPNNSNGKYGGSVDMRTAIMFSINVPAVDALYRYGRARGLNDFAARCRNTFGFENEIKPFLSSALGASEVSPLEMARAYSVFMLSGSRFEPYAIKKITGPTGEAVYDGGPNIKRGVMKADSADMLDACMRAVVTSGTAKPASAIKNARGKTGTTSDNRDAWFVGYTDQFLGVGWIANQVRVKRKDGSYASRYEEMSHSVFGGTHTVNMWTAIVGPAQELFGEKSRSHVAADGIEWSGDPIDEPSNDPTATPDDTADPTQGDGHTPVVSDPPAEDQPQVNPGDGPADGPRPERPPGENPPRTTDHPTEKPSDPPRDKPRPKDPPAETNNSSQTVTVFVCADTGLLANDACPEKTPRTYRRGREPKSYCKKHH